MSEKQSGITIEVLGIQVWLHFKWSDIWVGVYVAAIEESLWEIYVCIVPTLPIRFLWMKAEKESDDAR